MDFIRVFKAIRYSLLALLFSGKIYSSHIVGGEIFYDRISASSYKITLKVYRDCFNGQPPLDGINDGITPYSAAILTVYTADSTLVGTFDIGAPLITNIIPSINNPCIQPPGGICVQEGLYTYTLNLPPKNGGYYVIYQRCCRNTTILNLFTLQGATYYTFIPGPDKATINSSPRFVSFPPIYICNNIPFTLDHKATDPDGDQLVYSLCAPFQGLDNNCGSLSTPGCPTVADPPPYNSVLYNSPYSGSYPIASSPAFSINPSTGVLSGKPNTFGQFVIGVCVQEFRAGVLLNIHYRDFQFNVVNCIVQVACDFANQVKNCQGSTITFSNQSFGSIGGMTYLWNFGDPSTTGDTSNAVNPSYTYPDTGSYLVTLIANPNKPCSDTMQKTVHVYPELNVQFPPVNKQCFKGNAFNFQVQGQYQSYASFNWNFTSAATPSTSTSLNPLNVVYNQPGRFFVKLIAKQALCVDTFIDSVRVIKPPMAKINNVPFNWCDPARIGFGNGSSSELPLRYTWLFSDGTSSQAFQPVKVFSPAGIYSATLIAITTSVCTDSSLASVQNLSVNVKPMASFSFSPQSTSIFDPEITILNKASADVNKWLYTFGDGSTSSFANDIHVYQEYGDYTITQVVSNSYDCRDTVSQTVHILPEYRFWIPNAFTPDNNLRNDYFMPVVFGVKDYIFDVYSRWGELIYRSTVPNEGWNGDFNGKECQEGVYAWRVEFKNVVSSKTEVHYGHVLLLKNN